MILLEAKKDGEIREFQLPDTHKEITFGQVLNIAQLAQKGDPNMYLKSLVSVLSGVDPEFWEGCTDMENYLLIEAHCLRVSSDFSRAINGEEISYRPEKVMIGDQEVSFPEELLNETVGQYQDCIALWAAFTSKKDDWEKSADGNPLPPLPAILEAHGSIFKIYADKLINNDYSYKRAMSLDISQISWAEVYAWGNFFLYRAISLSRGIKSNVPDSNTQTTKLQPEPNSSGRIGAFFSRLIH
jgi:hypothetical protein